METTVDSATRRARNGAKRIRQQRSTFIETNKEKVEELVKAHQPLGTGNRAYVEQKRQSMEKKKLLGKTFPRNSFSKGIPSEVEEENMSDIELEKACRDFFKLCDEDESGTISPLEFSRVLKRHAKMWAIYHPQMKKDLFQKPLAIFDQMDVDGSGDIDVEEFVGCTYFVFLLILFLFVTSSALKSLH